MMKNFLDLHMDFGAYCGKVDAFRVAYALDELRAKV
jgi:hypothetical protein